MSYKHTVASDSGAPVLPRSLSPTWKQSTGQGQRGYPLPKFSATGLAPVRQVRLGNRDNDIVALVYIYCGTLNECDPPS